MRHTLTFDADVEAKIAEECRTSGKPFQEVVNTVLLLGFAVRQSTKSSPPLTIRPLHLDLKPGVSLESISALEEVEDRSRWFGGD